MVKDEALNGKTLLQVIETFQQKGAVSPERALTLEELDLPQSFEVKKGPPWLLGVLVEVDGKYYLSEERLKKVRKRLGNSRHRRFRRLLRHTASVPKGFLRHYVLNLLREKPMSGSELMDKIEEQTGGRWKPSPGSLYPLLAWFRDRGYTEALPRETDGMKRYKLTEQGKQFFEEQAEFGGKLQRKLEFLTPWIFGGFGIGPHSEKMREIREPLRRFMKAFHDLRRTLQENLTEENVKTVENFLSETIEKLEELREGFTKE
jgi:DNA-binding PadR family transcriptional regulator